MSHPTTLNGEVHSDSFAGVELRCKCPRCRKVLMNHCKQFAVNRLQMLRELAGRPLVIKSAFRCELHEEEAGKDKPGQHYEGVAFDIKVSNGWERMQIVQLALRLGATGIGVAKTFVHIDFRETDYPVMWRYS